MIGLRTSLAAAALAAGLVFGGAAQAAVVAPVKVQAKAVESLSPLSEVRHKKKWRKRHWRHRHGWGHRKWRHHHRYRPYYYDPYYYDYDYGWYDPYPRRRHRYYGGPGVYFGFGF